MDVGEMKGGVPAVASPVFGPSGKLIGSLAVVGTFHRELAAKYGSGVAVAAKKFSESIGGAPQLSFSQSIGARMLVLDPLRPK